MTHPYRRIAVKLRAKGKLATRKEIKVLNDFYRDAFSDVEDDEVIEKVNRELVKDLLFYQNGHCKAHNNNDCSYCLDKLRG